MAKIMELDHLNKHVFLAVNKLIRERTHFFYLTVKYSDFMKYTFNELD